MNVQAICLVPLTLILALACYTAEAFTPAWTRLFSTRYTGNYGCDDGGANQKPPPPPNSGGDIFQYGDDDENDDNYGSDLFAASLLGLFGNDQDERDDGREEVLDVEDCDLQSNELLASTASVPIRGGSTKSATNDILAGSKSSLETTQSYWIDAFQSMKTKITDALPFKKQTKSDADEIDLTKMKIQAVTAPQSDILPATIVRSAAQRSGLLGSVMRSDRINECARQLKKWYVQRGYVLHSVTGATLHSENGTATLTVQEPILSSMPVDIKFAKEVPIDPETGASTTMRKYREKMERRKRRQLRKDEWTAIVSDLNTTLIEATGRTKPKTLMRTLGLSPGRHFCWNGQKWQRIVQSGLFSKIWSASPVRMGDGTVQLQVLCQESPPRNLEYGISKSLYTGHWEGELDFKHDNILGGGESLGVVVRRGAKDPEPSVTLRFSDDKFGMKGGYDAQIFREHIAVDDDKHAPKQGQKPESTDFNVDVNDDDTENDAPPIPSASASSNDDSLLCRQGVKFSLRGPIPTNIVQQSSVSAGVERTSTRKGKHESIGSATLSLGPFVNYLPLGARASMATSASTGARVGEERLLPYSSASVTSRQIFPLFTERSSSATTGKEVNFALQHTLMAATSHFPRHEANAAGFAARIRGYSGSSNGPVDSSVTGSAEVRIPVTIPIQRGKIQQDGSVILFGDWMLANHQTSGGTRGFAKDDLFGKSSVGVGFRKSVQGIPLKYDVALTKDGKVGAFVSLGQDWEIY